MARQAEGELSKRIIAALNARHHFAYKNHGSIYMPKGLPDITGLARFGTGFFLETKMPGEQVDGLRPEQKSMLRRIVQASPACICAVVTTVREAIDAIECPGRYPMIFPDGRAIMVAFEGHDTESQRRILDAIAARR